MSETERQRHFKTTIAFYGRPELGEHDVVAYGKNWARAFTLSALMLERKLELKPGSGAKNIRDWPPEYRDISNNVMDEVDEFLDFVQNQYDPENPEHAQKYHDGIEEHLVFINGVRQYEPGADIADLRALGHWTIANQVDSGEITLTDALECV